MQWHHIPLTCGRLWVQLRVCPVAWLLQTAHGTGPDAPQGIIYSLMFSWAVPHLPWPGMLVLQAALGKASRIMYWPPVYPHSAAEMLKLASNHDTLAERSKAVAQGAIPKGRGFEPHRCHFCAAGLNNILALHYKFAQELFVLQTLIDSHKPQGNVNA